MRILFSHTNFPAQFGAFGTWLAAQGWDVTFATGRKDAVPPRGTRMFHFTAAETGAPEAHRHARTFDRAMRTAENFAAVAIRARAGGIEPDVVVAHSGWGAGTHAKSVWPEARFAAYIEWWYAHPRPDVLPDEPPVSCAAASRSGAAARNAPFLIDLAQADAIFCPSAFQAQHFPDFVRDRLRIMADGVDCATLCPDPGARGRLAELGVPPQAEVVTYATRGMEPYRGFPEFMRALEVLQKERPNLHAIVAGSDRAAYGRAPAGGGTWKETMLAELDLDLARIHFTGLLAAPQYRTLLQGTDLHVYLTVPFVLSWSFLEAMSVGCPLVASDVAPVHEALDTCEGALLVHHADPQALAAAMRSSLNDPSAARRRGARARRRALSAYDNAWIWPARADALRALARA